MKLKVKCLGNPDLNGEWDQKDIESEMRDLGYTPDEKGHEWTDWVLDHLFDFEFNAGFAEAVANPNMRSLTFMSEKDGFVEITKG